MKIRAYQNFIGEWEAVDENTFDAEYVEGSWSTKCPIGRGKTEEEAIADLKEQIEERGQ